MAFLAPSPAPSHQIHSIFAQFAAMRTGQIHSTSRGHGPFVFTPPVRTSSSAPPSAGSPIRTKTKTRNSYAPMHPPVHQTIVIEPAPVAPTPPTVRRPSLRRDVASPPPSPATSPPPAYSNLDDSITLVPVDSKQPISVVSPPSYCYAPEQDMEVAVETVRRLEKQERERRARMVASILLIRSQRSAKPIRRIPDIDPPQHRPTPYIPSGLSSVVTFGATADV
jgi:hypothetical protein